MKGLTAGTCVTKKRKTSIPLTCYIVKLILEGYYKNCIPLIPKHDIALYLSTNVF